MMAFDLPNYVDGVGATSLIQTRAACLQFPRVHQTEGTKMQEPTLPRKGGIPSQPPQERSSQHGGPKKGRYPKRTPKKGQVHMGVLRKGGISQANPQNRSSQHGGPKKGRNLPSQPKKKTASQHGGPKKRAATPRKGQVNMGVPKKGGIPSQHPKKVQTTPR